MSTTRYYLSTDPGAPSLDGTAASLINVLDACLVNGYGSGADERAPLGWAIAYTGTNKRVYRSASGLRHYYRVQDDGTVSGTYGARKAGVRGYVAMTDVDTGTGAFQPSVGFWTKSATANAHPRRWVVIGDERGVYIAIMPRWDMPYVNTYWFGDFNAFDPVNDPFHSSISVHESGDTDPVTGIPGDCRFNQFHAVNTRRDSWGAFYSPWCHPNDGPAAQIRHWLSDATFVPAYPSGGNAEGTFRWSAMSRRGQEVSIGNYPSPIVNLFLQPIYSVYSLNLNSGSYNNFPTFRIRGVMPGCYETLTAINGTPPFTTFTDVAGYPGREFMVLPAICRGYFGSSAILGGAALADIYSAAIIDITGPWR